MRRRVMAGRGRPFRSKLDGLAAARGVWLCLDCRAISEIRPTGSKHRRVCAECGRVGRSEYFQSSAEVGRACELLLMVSTGDIARLRCHPRYRLAVEGIEVATYAADFEYYDERDRRIVIEDVKPKGFMLPEAALKIALFNAINAKHGLAITIVQR